MSVLMLRGTVVSDGRRVADAVVTIRGDRIVDVGPVSGRRGHGEPLPPPSSRLLLPGLVDLHCHGGGGCGFPDADTAGARTAAEHHLAHGTTTLLGSLVSATPERLMERLSTLRPLADERAIAGIHLEGPFLSAARCGAQDPDAIVPGDPDLLDALLSAAAGTVRSMTLAPETRRYRDLLAVLTRHGVLPSLGHTDAGADQTSAAIALHGGVPMSATHLFNAMPPLHHRAPGAATACLAAAARREMVLELVADGVHLADSTVAAVFDLVGPDQIALVTDAIAAAGMPDGRYRLGSMDVRVVDRVARLAPTVAATDPHQRERPVAGGTARLIDVVRGVVTRSGVPLEDAVQAATLSPARLIGLDHEIGSLTPGKRADLLVTDNDLTPLEVIRSGVPVGRPGSAVGRMATDH